MFWRQNLNQIAKMNFLGNYFWTLGTPVFILFLCFHYWDLMTNNLPLWFNHYFYNSNTEINFHDILNFGFIRISILRMPQYLRNWLVVTSEPSRYIWTSKDSKIIYPCFNYLNLSKVIFYLFEMKVCFRWLHYFIKN